MCKKPEVKDIMIDQIHCSGYFILKLLVETCGLTNVEKAIEQIKQEKEKDNEVI